MKIIKLGIIISILFLFSGCTGEQSFEQFFNQSMRKNYTNPEIIHFDEYPDNYVVVIYSYGEDERSNSIGIAKKSKDWEWLLNGPINFESSWLGTNGEDLQLFNETVNLNLFYGAILSKPKRTVFVEDQEVKQIPLNEFNNLWYYVDFEGNSLDVEVYSITENGDKDIVKPKP